MSADELGDLAKLLAIIFVIPEFLLGIFMSTWVYQFILYRHTYIMKKRYSKASLITSISWNITIHCAAFMTLRRVGHISRIPGSIAFSIFGLCIHTSLFTMVYRLWMVSFCFLFGCPPFFVAPICPTACPLFVLAVLSTFVFSTSGACQLGLSLSSSLSLSLSLRAYSPLSDVLMSLSVATKHSGSVFNMPRHTPGELIHWKKHRCFVEFEHIPRSLRAYKIQCVLEVHGDNK